MPKMTHWNSPEPIDVPAEKAAVYAAQGWVRVDAKPQKVQPGITREAPIEPAAPAAESAPVKKAAAKRPAKKAAKKS